MKTVKTVTIMPVVHGGWCVIACECRRNFGMDYAKAKSFATRIAGRIGAKAVLIPAREDGRVPYYAASN